MRKLAILTILCLFQAFQANAAIKGSLSKEEMKELDAPTQTIMKDNGNLVKQEVSLTKYDRLTFNEGYKYDFKQDKNIPSYLELAMTRSERLIVLPDGRIQFLVKKGSFVDNIVVIMSHTKQGQAFFPKHFPSSFRLHNDFFISGDNVLDIINQLVAPWASTNNLHADTYINNIVEFSVAK
ncbi:hypothetical protein M6C35_001874 [Vibrio metschnikovii]|nr:hypothetical protein [Vibrio metschnikovii]